MPTPGQRVQQLILSNRDKVLFAGTAEGSVCAYMWGAEGQPTEGQQYQVIVVLYYYYSHYHYYQYQVIVVLYYYYSHYHYYYYFYYSYYY